MNIELISVLEKMKDNSMISDTDRDKVYKDVLNWYTDLFGNFDNIDIALDLLLYFYTHDNLDFYTCDEFEVQCKYLEKNYLLKKDKVLEAFTSSRTLVFGRNNHAENSCDN